MRNFILGTDWWTDCDDCVALRLLCRAAKKGEIGLLGIVLNGCMEDSITSVEGFLNCEGLDGGAMPLGIDLEGKDFGGNPPYQKRLAGYAKKYSENEQAENAVRLYRKLLAGAKEPVEMIEIGYLQAVAGLLESGPDEFSELDGVELVRQKVKKVWVMAGKWDENPGRENNFARNGRARRAAHIFCEKMPVPMTFLGYEVGFGVISGQHLKADDVLHQALCDHGSAQGRHSWDPMLVLLALIGDETAAGYRKVTGRAWADPETGENFFEEKEEGRDAYVVKLFEDGYYEKQINGLIG